MKVLLIDRTSPARERLVGEISELPDVQIEIQDADDPGVEAAITQLHPDVVLIDIDHSQGRGIEIIRQLHGRRAEGKSIIVAITSSNSLEYRACCHEAGALFFFDWVREQDWLMKSLVAIQEQLREG